MKENNQAKTVNDVYRDLIKMMVKMGQDSVKNEEWQEHLNRLGKYLGIDMSKVPIKEEIVQDDEFKDPEFSYLEYSFNSDDVLNAIDDSKLRGCAEKEHCSFT